MAGDTTNARVWATADVYIAPLHTTIPASISTPFSGSWELIGLLDGDAGFVESRSEDSTDLFAWGGIIVRSSRQNFKMTKAFTALEYNVTVRSLVYPGSLAGEIRVPSPSTHMIAFEKTDTTLGVTHRLISANYAEIALDGDLTENETDLQKYPLVATIIPDTAVSPARLFIEQYTTIGS